MKSDFSITENAYHIDNIFMVSIDTHLISTLRQSRSSMSVTGIEELISSIIIKGQRTPGDVYAFNNLEAESYVKEMNDLWNTDYKIENFESSFIKEKNDFFYLFLVAGHRRLQACKSLNFDYVCNLHFEKSFEDAIEWQLAENVQREELSQLDLITSATAYWIKLKKKNPRLTLKEFANKHLHKSVSWMNNALKFIRLPISIQSLITKTNTNKGVNYLIMIEFAKLYDFSVERDNPLDEKMLLAYIQHCISHKYTLEKVKIFCDDKKMDVVGQQALFTLTSEDVDKATIAKIRENRTKHMTQADIYLGTSTVIAAQITERCKAVAKDVLQKGKGLGEILGG